MGQRETGKVQKHTKHGIIKLYKFKSPDYMFSVIVKAIIVALCAYITFSCVNMITNKKIKVAASKELMETGNMLAQEILENSNIMTQYMIYLENHKDIAEDAKKRILTTVVTDYIAKSEYTYDTSDPAYSQVINILYENMKAENQIAKKEVETTAKPVETTVKNNEKNNNKKKRNKAIVPMPKKSGKLYTEKNIGSFKEVINRFYTVTNATTIKESDMPIKQALNKEFKITGNNNKHQILIYNTHSMEDFSNTTKDEDTTIIGVGNRLAQILREQFGYNVIHDKTKYDIVNGKLDRHEAYTQSKAGVKKQLKKYPSISLILDIHRDGVNDGTRFVTEINGKKTAQIMFFNGMSRFKLSGDIDYLKNPYRFENLALGLQMKVNAECYYPGFTRRNYVNAYEYNLSLGKQCMLIEVGAQTNTYQEAKNAAEPLAVLIKKVLGE